LKTKIFSIDEEATDQARLFSPAKCALNFFLHCIHRDEGIDTTTFATATAWASAAAGNSQVTDVTNILLKRAFHLAVDNQRSPNNSIDRQEEEATGPLASAEMILTQCSSINIDMQIYWQAIAHLEQFTERKTIKGRECWNKERTP
jgi:hypothetical protein